MSTGDERSVSRAVRRPRTPIHVCGRQRTCFAIPKVGYPQILVSGIDERDESGGAIEAEPSFLVVRASAGSTTKVIYYRLDLFVCAAWQGRDATRKQIKDITRDCVVKCFDPVR
jgi:hypothetical protein